MATISFDQFVKQGTGKVSDVSSTNLSVKKPVDQPNETSGVISRIINKQADSLLQRADEIDTATARERSGQQGKIESTIQRIGSGLAAYVLDPIKNVVSETPILKQATEAYGKVINWLANSDYSAIHELGKRIGEFPAVQDIVKLYDTDPSFKATVNATGNILGTAATIKGGVDTGTAAVNKVVDFLTPSKEIYAFHGTTPENAQSIKDNGFDVNKSRGGMTEPKAINLTTDEGDALHYAGGDKAGVVPTKLTGKNIKVYGSVGEYIQAVQDELGSYNGPNATDFLKKYDGVIINGASPKGDMILTTDPVRLSVGLKPTIPQAETGAGLGSTIKSKIGLAQKEASSVISYIDKEGNKVFTRVTPDELNILKDEVANIPEAKNGASQIHLDAVDTNNPNYSKFGKELSRDEFIKGHPQAGEILSTTDPKIQSAIKDATPDYENSTPTQRQKLVGRVQEGGVLKGRTVKPDKLNIEAGKELSNVPNYDPRATKLQKYQITKAEIAKRGEKLSSDLKKENIIVPKKEIVSKVRNAINQVPEESLLLQKSDPAIKNYLRVLNNAVDQTDGTLEGVLNLRKKLDSVYENARGKNAFGSDKIAALDEVHTAARNELTQFLIDNAVSTDVKASLRSQWNLYRALDELQVAAEQESGSSIGRLMQKYPITTRLIQKAARAVGLGAGIEVVK